MSQPDSYQPGSCQPGSCQPDPPRTGGLHLLVNPAAGRGRAAHAAQRVEDTLRTAGWRLRVTRTLSPAHAEQLALEAGPGDVVAVLSGDGLMARAAAGVRRSGALLAPLPGGRANDLAALLGIPRDPVAAASRLHLAPERRLDLGFAGGRPFFGLTGVGFTSQANERANATRWLTGPLVYAYSGALTFGSFRPLRFRLELDGVCSEFCGWDVLVGNSGRFGGGMQMCPGAELDDGLLDVLCIGPLARWQFPGVLGAVFSGTHTRFPHMTLTRARRVVLDAAAPLTVYGDGDPIATLPCEITVQRKAVRVLG